MNIYFYCDHPYLDEVGESLVEPIAAWIKDSNSIAKLVNERPNEDVYDRQNGWKLGIRLQTSKKMTLKKPVDFLYDLACEAKVDFVIGEIAENGSEEDICFIAYEEPKLGLDEIATYLGLKR
jgi:hypothetical protein